MSCGVGRRRGSDPAWLWLWCRPVAVAPIRPLAWEPPYAVEAAQEMAKRQPMDWAKIVANDVTDEGLISKICKQLIQLNINNNKKNQTWDSF